MFLNVQTQKNTHFLLKAMTHFISSSVSVNSGIDKISRQTRINIMWIKQVMWIDFHLHDGGLTITTALTVLSDNFRQDRCIAPREINQKLEKCLAHTRKVRKSSWIHAFIKVHTKSSWDPIWAETFPQSKFCRSPFCGFCVIQLTNQPTNGHGWKLNLLGGGNKSSHVSHLWDFFGC